MTTSALETQRQTALHFWNQGVRPAKEIHTLTKIPTPRIYYNLRKLKKTGGVEHKKGAGRPPIVSAKTPRAIGQHVRRDPIISLGSLATKISRNNVQVSHETIRRHLHALG